MGWAAPLTFSAISNAWSQPQRLALPNTERGSLRLCHTKMTTSTTSQVVMQVGYGYRVSAASAVMAQPVKRLAVPPTAGAWNVSGMGGSATTFAHALPLSPPTTAVVDYDYSNSAAGALIYSGSSLRTSAGVWVRVIRGAGAGTPDATVYFDVGT